MSTLLLILIPALVIPWIARLVWPHQIKWFELAAALVVAMIITSIVYGLGLYRQTGDVEIINGQVTSKLRVQDKHLESYSCHCRTNSKGVRSCSTCYRERYTVDWFAETTVGRIRFDYTSSLSKSVYNKADPAAFTVAQIGDPAARQHEYTNYIKAAPDSLFHAHDIKKFEQLIPEYPSKVYNYMKIDRALARGVNIPDVKQWNQDISSTLRMLGPQKHVNLVIVFANTSDQNYIEALKGKWIGGKKNDVIVVFGTTQYPKIDFVDVISWTDNQLFKIQLRDELLNAAIINRETIVPIIHKQIAAGFQRKEMKDFEYLNDQVEPPTWVLTLALILGTIASIAMSFLFYKHDPFAT